MNIAKVRVILEKINQHIPSVEKHKSTLDKDVLLGYIRQLYDAVLEDEALVQKALTQPTSFELKDADVMIFSDDKVEKNKIDVAPKNEENQKFKEQFFAIKEEEINEEQPIAKTEKILHDEPILVSEELEIKKPTQSAEIEQQATVEPEIKTIKTEVEEIKVEEPKKEMSVAERILSELRGFSKSEINELTKTDEIKDIKVEERKAETELFANEIIEEPKSVSFMDVLQQTTNEQATSTSGYVFKNGNVIQYFNEQLEDYGDLSSALARQKVNDLREGLAIYQRYEFVQELFGGDNTLFDSIISKLNRTFVSNEALEIIDNAINKIEPNSPSDEVLRKFIHFVRRKF